MGIGFFGIPQRIVWSGVLGTLGMERRIGSTQGLDRRMRRVRERNTGLRERNVGEKATGVGRTEDQSKPDYQ